MGNINPTYFDRVRYTLFNKLLKNAEVEEPIGWNSDEKELARHEQYHGIVSRFSNSLKFIGSGKEYIDLVYNLQGINAETKLKREEKHPKTDIFELSYTGYLDLSTYEKENNQIGVKFNSGGLEQLLKSRESEQVEIDRIETMDGKPIPELQPITVALDGRRIFLKSKWETDIETPSIEFQVESDAGNTRKATTGFPLILKNKSHEEAQSVLSGSFGNENVGSTGMMFFANGVEDQEITIIGENIQFKPIITNWEIQWAGVHVCLTVFENDLNYNVKNREYLFSGGFNDSSSSEWNKYLNFHNKLHSLNFTRKIKLLKNESVGIELFIEADLRGGNNRVFRVNFTEMSGLLSVEEDSFFEKTTTKAVLNHELIERLVTINTNKEKAFYSEFLGRKELGYKQDGPGAFTAVTHGFWIRQFDKLPIPTLKPKVENLFKPLTTSFKDAVGSIDAVWNIGIGIETVDNKERVRLEEKSFFYNNNVLIRLPFQAKNIKRSVATEYYYSGLEFGGEKGGEYEEATGLDEYNTRSNFITVITRVKEVYSKISKFRSDSAGMEFARRKPKSLNDTEDSSYDNDVFHLDLKPGITSVYEQRKWQDDFDKEPTGIFSPETATNLRFSPFNCLLRHSWWFGGGFKQYASDYVRYGSSKANSQLKTKLKGKNEYAENGNIINSELNRARFFPEWIEFDHECTFDIMQMVEGKTTILGKEIMNFYGLVEFINEDFEKERGFLFNLKPNGTGKWKLLKANR